MASRYNQNAALYLVYDSTNIRLSHAPNYQSTGARAKRRLTLDGDEVSPALVGDGLGEQRLSASGRAVEQRSLRSAHAELLELVRVLHRVLLFSQQKK